MSKSNDLVPDDYQALLAEVKERVRAAQYAALKAVNKHLVTLYWDIGRMTTERQAAGTHGTAVVQRLAADLQAEFPGMAGFSWRNLFNMSEFYLAYRDQAKLQPLVAKIGWTHNLVIFQRCKDPLEREFYLRMTAKFGWTKAVLIHQIENQSYEKTLLGQTNFDRALTPKLRAQAKLAVKDEYTFDFLELGEEHSERELERALIARIEQFLRAMGGLFAFAGSQFRLDVDGKEYFVDLLLFHRRLGCLVAIDLKIGEFEPEFVGKMQFYLTAEAVEQGSRLLPANTILVVVRGMSPAKEFRIAMTGRSVAFNQDLKALACEPSIAPKYLFCALAAQRTQIRDRATEAFHGTKKLDTAVLTGIPILLPGFRLQRQFCDVVCPMNAQWDNLWRQNRDLRQARALLLPRLMSGEIEV